MPTAKQDTALYPDPKTWWLLYFPEHYAKDSIVIADHKGDLLEVFYRERATVDRTQAEAAAAAELIMRACRTHARLCASVRASMESFKKETGRYPDNKELADVIRMMAALLEEAGG